MTGCSRVPICRYVTFLSENLVIYHSYDKLLMGGGKTSIFILGVEESCEQKGLLERRLAGW